jgi:hypothetical protein
VIFTGDLTMTRTTSGETTQVRADSNARLFGASFVKSWSLSTMDRKSGRPQEFLEVKPGEKAERWRFRDDGISHEKLRPHKSAPHEPLEAWAVSKTEMLAGGADPAGWVHDYIAMIVRLRELPITKPGDQAIVRVSTNRGAVRLRISASEERTESRTFTDMATGARRSVDLRELRLRVSPLEGEPAETKGFMNMEGETELWVEATTRTLIEISGNVPKVPGRVVITLSGYRSATP